MRMESGAYEGAYTFASRFKDGKGTNPDELLGAAHAGCFSMALSLELSEAGYEPQSINTRAEVTFEVTGDGPAITGIKLITEANVPDINNDSFQQFTKDTKEGCPVSKALAGTTITLDATLM